MHKGRGHPVLPMDEVVELYEKGHSTIEIAEKYQVTPQAVWWRLKELGLARDKKTAQRVRRMREKKIA